MLLLLRYIGYLILSYIPLRANGTCKIRIGLFLAGEGDKVGVSLAVFQHFPSSFFFLSFRDEMAHKAASLHSASKDGLERTSSLTKDGNGNTIVVDEDGESFVIDVKAERALLWKFDLRILPLL